MVPLRIEASLKKNRRLPSLGRLGASVLGIGLRQCLGWLFLGLQKKKQKNSTCRSTTQKVSPKSTPNAPVWLEPSSPSLPTIHPHHHLDKNRSSNWNQIQKFMTSWHIATMCQVPTGKNTFLDGKTNTYLSVALTSWPCMSERHVFCCRKGCKVSFPRLPRLLPKRFRNSFSRFIFRFSCHDMNKSGMGHLSLLLAAASFWSGKYQGVGILGYPCAGDLCTYGLIKREGSSKRWASKKFPGTRNRLVNNGFRCNLQGGMKIPKLLKELCELWV